MLKKNGAISCKIQVKEKIFSLTQLIVRRISIRAFVTALLFIISSKNIFPQHYESFFSSGEHIKIDNKKSVLYSMIVKDGKIQSVYKKNPDEIVSIIVTLKDQPLAAYQVGKISLQKASAASVYTTLQSKHASFRTALNTISRQLSSRLKSDYSYTITREYYRALNGIALKCKAAMMDRIRSLPMVEHLGLDKEVKANLEQSVHQIRADIVQDSLGITGKDVLVGNIDSGMDYNNPAFGGGFGPAYRVIGGYDFANNDSDPIDDFGHGTHVAGIT